MSLQRSKVELQITWYGARLFNLLHKSGCCLIISMLHSFLTVFRKHVFKIFSKSFHFTNVWKIFKKYFLGTGAGDAQNTKLHQTVITYISYTLYTSSVQYAGDVCNRLKTPSYIKLSSHTYHIHFHMIYIELTNMICGHFSF